MTSNYFKRGIKINTGFSLPVQSPLDARTVVENITELNSMPDVWKYPGLLVYVKDEDRYYKYNGIEFKIYINNTTNGLDIYHPTPNKNDPPNVSIGDIGSTVINPNNGDLWTKKENPDTKEIYWDKIGSASGASAYEIAVENGFNGTEEEWLESLKGERGNLWITANFLDETNLSEPQVIVNAEHEELADIQPHDIYTNPITKNMFRCESVDYEAGTSTWSYIGTSKGDKGDSGIGIYISSEIPVDGSISKSTITPSGIRINDHIIASNGSLYTVTAIAEDNITVASNNLSLKGKTGEGFKVSKTYPSIDAMNADFNNGDIPEGSFVMISSTVNDEDNAKLYVKGADEFTFIVDMSGASGVQGQSAYEIAVENGYEGTEEEWILSLKGSNGKRGTKWFTGVAISGAEVSNSEVASITDAIAGDIYLNTTTGEYYTASENENANIVWSYTGKLASNGNSQPGAIEVKEGDNTKTMTLRLIVSEGTILTPENEESNTTT